jgi:hypothetical protein
MARSNDLDIRASADRITALFNTNQAEAALAFLEEQRQNQSQVVQEALDRYIAADASASIARHAQQATEPPEVSALQRLQQAAVNPPRFPEQTQMAALTDAQAYDVYASIVRVRGNDAALDGLARPNERLVLGLRQENSTLAAMQDRAHPNSLRTDDPATPIDEALAGTGVYNDRLVVLWKDSDGTRHLQVAQQANTEPTAQYDHHAGNTGHRPRAEGGVENRTFAPSAGYENIARPRKIEGEDVNGDGIRDLGRLAEGTIEMRMGQHPNPQRPGTMDSALRPSQAAVAAGQGMIQRDTNADGWFDQADIGGVQDLNDTFKIHRGSGGNTDSAGCQTIHPAEYQGFIDAVRGDPGQTRWQYVLTSTAPGPVRQQQLDQAPGREAGDPTRHGEPGQRPLHPHQRPDAHAPRAHGPEAAGDRPVLHPLHGQAVERVGELDARMGRPSDAYSGRMSASLARLAKEHGLERIDHVVLSERTAQSPAGANVFIVQGELSNPAHLRAHMSTDVAVNTPVEQSLAKLQALESLAVTQAQSQQQERVVVQEEGSRQRGMV